jgi:hypothetical protein
VSAKPATQLQIGDDGAVGEAVNTLVGMAQTNSEGIAAATQGLAQVAQVMAEASNRMAESSERMAVATEHAARVQSAPKRLMKDPTTGEKVVVPMLQ